VTLLIPVLVIGVIALVGMAIVRSARAERKRRSEIALTLGFTPVEPTPDFNAMVNALYGKLRVGRQPGDGAQYHLSNVFGRHSADAEMFLFDLKDKSGDDASRTERQAVLIVSPHLDMPAFVIFPRADVDGVLSKLGNRLLEWVISRWGDPVEFPDAPDFERRYIVTAPEPDAARRFLDEDRLGRLAETRLLNIHAWGNMFTLARIDFAAKADTVETASERVDLARSLFEAFQSGR
jgi:hypothetical protein